MKRTLLLSIILGLTITLTGCKSNEAESGIQQNETSVTTSETALNVSTSDISDSSQMQETEPQHSEAVVNKVQDMPSDGDTPVSASKEQPKNAGKSDSSVPQLETVPEDAPVSENVGDFGELFS